MIYFERFFLPFILIINLCHQIIILKPIRYFLIFNLIIIIILLRLCQLLLIFDLNLVALSKFSTLEILGLLSTKLFHKRIICLFRELVHRLRACEQSGFLFLKICDLSLSHSDDKNSPNK